MRGGIISLIGGVLIIIFGLVLAEVVLSTAATAGADANIGSFGGSQALNDIIPLVYYAVIVIAGVSLIGLGGRAVASGR